MEDIIKCPHCSYLHDGLDYIEVGDMDGEFEMICENCEREFVVKFSTKIIFETEK